MKRIGMLTSGGDCQALNAAMRRYAARFTESKANLIRCIACASLLGFLTAETRSFVICLPFSTLKVSDFVDLRRRPKNDLLIAIVYKCKF